MTHRMAIAVLALIGFFVALYLLLWKLGMMGPIVCVTGGCETVQTSEYSMLLGLPVAIYGVLGFTSLFAVSVVGLQPRWIERRGPTILLAVFSGAGVAFTGYLTYLEAAVIKAWCQWCIGSAVIITAIFVVAVSSLRGWSNMQTAV